LDSTGFTCFFVDFGASMLHWVLQKLHVALHGIRSSPRKRKDGTVGHTAQIRIKSGGKVVFTESQTFDRKPAAQAWLKRRETELAAPGALTKPVDPPLKDVIDQYNQEKQREHGKTKRRRSTPSRQLRSANCAAHRSPAKSW